MGVYKRKQENTLSNKKAVKKKERKHALDQESNKKKKILFFLIVFLVENVFSFIFLTFFFSFIDLVYTTFLILTTFGL